MQSSSRNSEPAHHPKLSPTGRPKNAMNATLDSIMPNGKPASIPTGIAGCMGTMSLTDTTANPAKANSLDINSRPLVKTTKVAPNEAKNDT